MKNDDSAERKTPAIWPVACLVALAFAAAIATVMGSVDYLLPLPITLWLAYVALSVWGDPFEPAALWQLNVSSAAVTLLTPLLWLCPRAFEPVLLRGYRPERVLTDMPDVSGILCSYAVPAAVAVIMVVAAVVGFIVTLIVGAIARAAPTLLLHWFRLLSVVGLLAVASQCAMLTVRTFALPAAATYLATLPAIAKVQALDAPWTVNAHGDTWRHELITVDGVDIERTQWANGPVRVTFHHGDPSAPPCDWTGSDAFTVSRDARSQLIVVNDNTGAWAVCREQNQPPGVSLHELLPWVRPPRGWLASTLVGLVASVALLAARRRCLPRLGATAFLGILAATLLLSLHSP